MIENIASEEQYARIIKDNPKVIFKYGAKWCAPCKRIQPDFEVLAGKYQDVKFCCVDIDTIELEDSAEIATVPTFLIYNNGLAAVKFIGTDLIGLEKALIDQL